MENEKIIKIIIGITVLLFFISKLFYKKINLRDIYKKLFILSILLFNILLISFFIIKDKIDFIKNSISGGNYEIFLILIPIIILLGFIIFYIIRLFLGTIDIEILGNNFTSGDKLNGEIKLKLKKNIQNSNLCIYLRGYEYHSSAKAHTFGKCKKIHNNKITFEQNSFSSGGFEMKYEEKIILEKNTFFEANYSKNYNFSFNIPYLEKNGKKTIGLLKKSYDNEDLSEEQKEKALKLANKFLNFAGVDSGKEYLKLWKIEVRLEKKGIDLFNQKKVNIIRKLKEN